MPSFKQMMPHWVQVRLRLLYTRLNSYRHALPDFIIIGAQKSGTSSLYSYLSQHPQLLPSLVKEVHFFDGGLNPSVDTFEKGPAWYRAHFPLKKDILPHQKTFEASPFSIFHPRDPKRIFELLPNVKMIALLRNPTERAISHFFHSKRLNRESLSLYEALLAEEKRLESIIKEQDYKSQIFRVNSYKSRGLYKEQLERYLNYFPGEQIIVINSEKFFFSEPENTLRQVFKFVGVDPEFKIKDLQPRNVGYNRSQVAPDIYEYLNSYFWTHNQALYELIGQSYDW